MAFRQVVEVFQIMSKFSMLSTYRSWMRQRVATKTLQQECELFVIDAMENEQNLEQHILNVLLVKELERKQLTLDSSTCDRHVGVVVDRVTS